MSKKVKVIAKTFFSGLGIAAFLFLVSNYFNPLKFTVNFLWWLACVCFVVSVCGALIFKEGVGPKSLWIRRGVVILIAILTMILTEYLFGINTDVSMLARDSTVILVVTPVVTGIAYIFADRAEKRYLQKINDKLNQNNNE
jgi:hypothetical protein